jgi:RNA polymerase sigma factor (sigma-70 family)
MIRDAKHLDSEVTNPIDSILDHVFRHESGKMKSVLVRLFGSQNIELIEDAVQDALVRAVEQWSMKGIPANPSAWLIEVAKNRMLDILRRGAKSVAFAGDEAEYAIPDTAQFPEEENERSIQDDVLAMMFTCCHPSIGVEVQITLILKILCGFSTAEIAKAYLTSEETIQKRLFRAKEIFRSGVREGEGEGHFAIPPAHEIPTRLHNVLQAIYLLFNEGYNSTHHDQLIRRDLMAEAFRLCDALAEHPQTSHPEVFALAALTCFHAARTASRTDDAGNILLLEQQNRSLWDRALIERGIEYMARSAAGNTASRFHVEAGIAYHHCIAPSMEATNWLEILALYDMLIQTYSTPVTVLNRAVALAEVCGAEAALISLQSLDPKVLDNYYLYHALLGDMLRRTGRTTEAVSHLQRALSLTQSPAEQRLLAEKLTILQ